jgi:hypothetical protein
MARTPKGTRRETLSVRVDECRVRVQTGEQTIFIDARKAEDRATSNARVVGSLRLLADDRGLRPPCHKRNFLVVYCA